MERRAQERAALLYNTIDTLPLFICHVAKEDRSLMNAVFFMSDEEKEKLFLEACRANGMVGVKGYRTVGGLRVSMYNALPLSSVQAICDLMVDFCNKAG